MFIGFYNIIYFPCFCTKGQLPPDIANHVCPSRYITSCPAPPHQVIPRHVTPFFFFKNCLVLFCFVRLKPLNYHTTKD